MSKVRKTFFSSIAHELRTPLNAIIPILRMVIMLLSNIPNIPVDIIKSLKISLTSALHLESVVEDCLDISRM